MSTLKTARLTLSCSILYDGIDLKHQLKWLNDGSVTKFSEQRHYTHSQKTQLDYLKSFEGTPHQFWEIVRDSVPIGTMTAYIDHPNRVANVGIMIGDHRVWGNGYGSEAWDGVCNFLFSDGIRKVEAGCMASNSSMIRILEKTGFKHEAAIAGHFLLDGKPEDKVCYGKNRQAEIIQLNPGK